MAQGWEIRETCSKVALAGWLAANDSNDYALCGSIDFFVTFV